MKNLYLVSRTNKTSYDEYDAIVVCAKSPKEARYTHPDDKDWNGTEEYYSSWQNAEELDVKLLGVADDTVEEGVVLASYNAG
jgi:hypothetical protein